MNAVASPILAAATLAASLITTRAFADEVTVAANQGAKVPVTLAPSEREGVELREIVGTTTTVAYASNGQAVSAVSTHYNTLCVAPCSASVAPGTKLVVAGDDFPMSSEFRAPRREQKLSVEPGSSVGAFFGNSLFLLGATGIVTGATFVVSSFLVSERTESTFRTIGLASLAGGALFTGSGIALAYSSATRVNDEHGERVASGGRRLTVGYTGHF